MAPTDEPRTLGQLLTYAAQRFGDRRALVFPSAQLPDGALSFAQLDECVRHKAAVLTSMGIRRGDHVGLLLHNGPDFITHWLAAAVVGAVTVPLNARYRSPELAYVIRQSRIKVLFTSRSKSEEPDLAARVQESLSGAIFADPPGRLALAGAPDLEYLMLAGHEPQIRGTGQAASPLSHDIALMMYTSGTTAHPKGCLISHETLLCAGRQMASQGRYDLTTKDRMWNPLPMFHMSSLHPFVACLWSGCTFLSMMHFDAPIAVRQVKDERVTILYPAFPTIANELLAVPGFSGESLALLRQINCVAPPDGLRRLQQSFPQAAVTSVYGLTEAGGVVAYGNAQESLDVRVTTCGKPFAGIEVRIATTEGTTEGTTDDERVGEIQLKGWCLFAGYFEQPQATHAASTPDGWLRSGDLGSLDAEGRLCYRGRLKDVIKVGGENVSALEIESVLMRRPAVKLAQVIGVPDDRHGEVPVAFVELHEAHEASADALLDFCRSELASFKVPRRLLFVSEWPMSATKIQKHRLRERLESLSRPA